jgi:hypothetical protein
MGPIVTVSSAYKNRVVCACFHFQPVIKGGYMRSRSKSVNEFKSSLTDDEWEDLGMYMELYGVPTVADAARKAIRQLLYGTVGNLPKNLLSRSAQTGQEDRRMVA